MARVLERGLGNGMILGEELEHDFVADVCLDVCVLVHELHVRADINIDVLGLGLVDGLVVVVLLFRFVIVVFLFRLVVSFVVFVRLFRLVVVLLLLFRLRVLGLVVWFVGGIGVIGRCRGLVSWLIAGLLCPFQEVVELVGGVDGEDHPRCTVVDLAAIEPLRAFVHDSECAFHRVGSRGDGDAKGRVNGCYDCCS